MAEPKYIIHNGELRMGRVDFHCELIPEKERKDKKLTKGGGYYNINNDTKRVIFYGSSFDYGKAQLKDIEDIFITDTLSIERFKNFEVYYYNGEYLTDIKDPQLELIRVN